MEDFPDLYRILQVDPDADSDVIDAVYRRLARKYHPDVNPAADANRQMQDINIAYEVLGDPDRRADYDRRMRLLRLRRNGGRAAAAVATGFRATTVTRSRRKRHTDDSPPRPALVATPEVLDFGSLARGERRTASIRVSVTLGRIIRGRVSPNQPWISVSAPETLVNHRESTIDVTIDTSHLRDGIYHYGSISIESLAYGGVTVPVTLFIPEEPKPQLKVEPFVLQFSAAQDAAEPVVKRLRLWDDSNCPMSGTIHVKPSWLKADVFEFENVTEQAVELAADVKGLRAGQCYSGRIEIHASNGRATVLVKVTVQPSFDPVLDFDDNGWAAKLSAVQAGTEWERTFLQTVTLQAKQLGWQPSSAQKTIIEHLWRRHIEKDC